MISTVVILLPRRGSMAFDSCRTDGAFLVVVLDEAVVLDLAPFFFYIRKSLRCHELSGLFYPLFTCAKGSCLRRRTIVADFENFRHTSDFCRTENGNAKHQN